MQSRYPQSRPPLQGRRGAPNAGRQYNSNDRQETWTYSPQDVRWNREDHLRQQSHMAQQQAKLHARPVPLRPHQPGNSTWNFSREDRPFSNEIDRDHQDRSRLPPRTLPASLVKGQEQQRTYQGTDPLGPVPGATQADSIPFRNPDWASPGPWEHFPPLQPTLSRTGPCYCTPQLKLKLKKLPSSFKSSAIFLSFATSLIGHLDSLHFETGFTR
jgi:hypothetical protein